ncbi:MAG: DUF11 domain-containing protein [Gemmatimonadota bacterium]|nr:MAG: DUF11 domain-containing protein [Gemmatimonadota bacterium]
MKKIILSLITLTLITAVIFQIPGFMSVFRSDVRTTDSIAFAQVLRQENTEKIIPGIEEEQFINLRIDIAVEDANLLINRTYEVEIQYENVGTDPVDSVNLVFYAPNHHSGNYYTILKSDIGNFCPRDATCDVVSDGDTLHTIRFALQDTLFPSGGGTISFTLEVINLLQCKSLSNCVDISARGYTASEVCEEVEVNLPDLVPTLECTLNSVLIWIHNLECETLMDAFRVTFIVEGRDDSIHQNIHLTIPAGDSVAIPSRWVAPASGWYRFHVIADSDSMVVETNEENNSATDSCEYDDDGPPVIDLAPQLDLIYESCCGSSRVWIGNFGNGDVNNTFQITFHEGSITGPEVHSVSIDPVFPAWGSTTLYVDFDCPIPGDTIMYYVHVDFNNTVTEIDDATLFYNNIDSVSCYCCGFCDLEVTKTAQTLETCEWEGRTYGCVSPGEIYTYSITLENTGTAACTNVTVTDNLQGEIENVFNVSPAPQSVSNLTIQWVFSSIPADTTISLTFDAQVRSSLLPGEYLIINDVEEDVKNSSDRDTVIAVNPCDCPVLSVDRPTLSCGGTVTITIQSCPLDSLRLVLTYPNGRDTTLWNDSNIPENWSRNFSNTDYEGQYTVSLFTTDFMAKKCSTEVHFTVDCEPTFYLDKNKTTSSEQWVEAIFRVTKDAHVKMYICNLVGEIIRERFVDRDYPAGPHDERWDLKNDDGELVASGVYVFVMETGQIVDYRKVAVLR